MGVACSQIDMLTLSANPPNVPGSVSRYRGRRVALLTQHGKEQVLRPVLEPALGCVVDHVAGYDTDLLGTFTRETPRPGTQLEALRRKARKGMELSGLPLGLASEGSFGSDPFAGLFPWNVEMLMWIDDELGIEVVGMAQGPGRSGHVLTGDWAALEAFSAREGFPQHHLVLRPEHEDDPRVHKGLSDPGELRRAFEACRQMAANGQVFAETDLRAFANPTRMERIGQAAADLVQRLQSCCPVCAAPGFAVTERVPGLACGGCGLPTAIHHGEVWTCLRCPHQVTVPRTDLRFADPAQCGYCNP